MVLVSGGSLLDLQTSPDFASQAWTGLIKLAVTLAPSEFQARVWGQHISDSCGIGLKTPKGLTWLRFPNSARVCCRGLVRLGGVAFRRHYKRDQCTPDLCMQLPNITTRPNTLEITLVSKTLEQRTTYQSALTIGQAKIQPICQVLVCDSELNNVKVYGLRAHRETDVPITSYRY